MPARTSSSSIFVIPWILKPIPKPFPAPSAWTPRSSKRKTTVCPAIAKSFSIALDQTKPPAPVWRSSSENKASRVFALSKAAWRPGANTNIPSPTPDSRKFPLSFKFTTLDLQPRQDNTALRLVLPLLILVAHFAIFVRFKEKHLAQPFIRINLRRQRRGIADLQRHKPFPLRLKRRHVHNNPAPRIRRLPQTNRQNIPRYPEIFHRSSQRKRIRRNQALVALKWDQGSRVEMLGINN